ncbi:protein RKD4-like [Bidens hawaiensis]|uniref:protein RKD4-like n=1 Tax=Bidens hawaiensis TaxID=980011 RepID=UPI004048F427
MDHNLFNLDHWPYFDQDDTQLYMQFFNLLDMNRVYSPLKQDKAFEFPYFDPIDEYLSLWDCWDDGHLPLLSDINHDIDHDDHSTCVEVKTTMVAGGGRRARPLEFEDIERCFEMPITKAAKKLNVGLTMLKKRCRELNIKRWPHRKLKSIKSLMQNVKEMGLEKEMEMLEEQKRMIKKLPQMDLTQRTKRLRQACFKATYKKRRSVCTR